MTSDIEQILYPTVLSSLREDLPPVKCIIWRGGNEYEMITFDNMYPFDTIDTVKYMIYNYYKDSTFIPKFTFVGIPNQNEEQPNMDTLYEAIDYLWYPIGTNDPKNRYKLKNPIKNLKNPDMRFVTSDGNYASPNYEIRGRSTIEQLFLKSNNNNIPIFHVFPLKYLLKEYKGIRPIGQEEWYKKFAPYYPDITLDGSHEPTNEDNDFASDIESFISQRDTTLYRINRYLEEGVEVPTFKLNGIKQMLLTWKKPIENFEGIAPLFYQIQVTENRPYLRLIPANGSAITKIHVKGVIPIPTLDDPRILESWGKEISPTPGIDFCSIKYIHRPSIGITQPVYGSIHIFNDGTMNLLLQPPKNIRKLEVNLDFRNFNKILQNVFSGLPQQYDNFELKEIACLFTTKLNIKSKKFNKTRLLQRLPFFQYFFKEIQPLPNENPIISLRYKAVSQYASEDKIFTFITQLVTDSSLDGESYDMNVIIPAIQNEFQFSKKEATNQFAEWLKKRGTFTVQIPEEGQFIESYNPGIDIHIYEQHPSYYFHVNRIDNYETYIRVFSLLSLLFIEDDDYFRNVDSNYTFEEASNKLEEISLEREEVKYDIEDNNTIGNMSVKKDIVPNRDTVSSVPAWMLLNEFGDDLDQVNKNEVIPETVPKAINAAVGRIEDNKIKKRTRPKIVDEKKVIEKEEEKKEEQKIINPKSWFIKKLQEIDPRLFDYKTSIEDENVYSRKCAGYDDRQPSILTEEQYDKMREIYENDNIYWLIYPLEGSEEPIEPIGVEETITVMKYGSDPNSINYYFCPEYYCLSDEIMIRKKDFEATIDRDGNPKPPNTCPFCYGKLITDRKKPMKGYTVIKRKDKKGATYHKYIDFMSKTTHPENFALPCCFLKQSTLRIADPQFSHLRSQLQDTEIEEKVPNNIVNEIEEDDYKELIYKGDETIEYAVLLETLHKRYIIESNKEPGPGIFAVIPEKFDTFFTQNSTENIITRVALKLKLRPNANGFIRLGTENTQYESLLGVIAPLIYKNSINEVRERILEVVVPKIFINSHFGNLVLEFYNPSDGSAMPSTKQQLAKWSQDHLGISMNSNNIYSLLRIFNAYQRFIKFINNPMQRKELRHIQPLLAEPGLFTQKGIQLIIMEDNGTEPITIKCPTFGVSMDRNRKNDIAFISRSIKTISSTAESYARYELYLYTSNKPAKGGDSSIHETILKWDFNSRRYWIDIVKLRVDEYYNQCQSRYRSIYTSQDGVNSMALIPLSKVIESSPVRPEGIIKDSYNHIVGVTFRSKPGSQYLVALPVVDDGIISISSAFSVKSIYLDWEDFKTAPLDDVIQYYKMNLEPLFTLYPGYNIEYIVRNKLDNKIVAVQLKNGIYIPVSSPKNEKILDELELKVVTVEEFQWDIDKKISGIYSNNKNWDSLIEQKNIESKCGTDSELLRKSDYSKFEELYQQFRFMFSNWITSSEINSGMRKDMEEIIFNTDLPEYERRKRLYIYLSSLLLSWFYADPNKWESPKLYFLRKDCRLINNPKQCDGTCYWKSDNNKGKCLLHVDEVTELSELDDEERLVSTPELFTKRIIDELIRFPARRKQLMKKGIISKVSSVIEPIRIDDQYIIPESSLTWTNLLRFDWMKQTLEEPKYYEEMSREFDNSDKKIPEDTEMTPELYELFGEDTQLRLKIPKIKDKSSPLLPFTTIIGLTLEQLGLNTDATILSKESLIKYVKLTSKPIGIINFRENINLNNRIQFVKPASGSFDSVILFVFLEDTVGIMIEEDGNPYVKIDKLPGIIKDRWLSAGIVMIRKKPVIEEEQKVPVIIGKNPPMFKRKKPLIVAEMEKKEVVEEKPVIRRRKIIEQEEKKDVAEEKPVIRRRKIIAQEEKKEVVEEKPVIRRRKIIAQEEKKEVVEEKPVIRRRKIIAQEENKKPIVEKKNEVVEEKPVIRRRKIIAQGGTRNNKTSSNVNKNRTRRRLRIIY